MTDQIVLLKQQIAGYQIQLNQEKNLFPSGKYSYGSIEIQSMLACKIRCSLDLLQRLNQGES